MTVKRYQDLVAWQLSDELKKRVYGLVEGTKARDDREFCRQIRDSASSAPGNIAEGFGAYEHRQAARYARIARASLIETQNHLGDGADRGYWSREISEEHQRFADRAIGATTKWLRYLSTTEAPSTWKRDD